MTLSRAAHWLMSRPFARKPAATRRGAAFRPTLASLEAREVPAAKLIDTLHINLATEAPVTTSKVLEVGQTYRLVASGTGVISTATGLRTDAEYVLRDTGHDTYGKYRGTPVDNRIEIEDVGGFNGWGEYRPENDHVYTIYVTGEGEKLSAFYKDVHSTSYADNVGSLTVKVYHMTAEVSGQVTRTAIEENGSEVETSRGMRG